MHSTTADFKLFGSQENLPMISDQGPIEQPGKEADIKEWPMFFDERGLLLPIDLSAIPFPVKRIFLVTGCPAGMKRGNHAHKETRQYVLCIKGMIRLWLENKAGQTSTILPTGAGLLIEKMTWDTLSFMTGDEVLLVFCDTLYDTADYITDYNIFKKMLADENNSRNDCAQ